jgi:hypothetical protein
LIALAVSLVACGCATGRIRPADPYRKDHAYLYGRFTIEGQRMTFDLHCRDGATYAIEFSNRREVQMIEMVPSVCELETIEYGNALQRVAAFRLLRNEVLDPGGVYYIGDYGASGTYDTMTVFIATEVRQSWRLKRPRDDYARTTADMRRAYPNFASVSTEDRVAP